MTAADPAVSAFVEVVADIERLVLESCPSRLRPKPLPAAVVLGLAEKLAHAARLAGEAR